MVVELAADSAAGTVAATVAATVDGSAVERAVAMVAAAEHRSDFVPVTELITILEMTYHKLTSPNFRCE